MPIDDLQIATVSRARVRTRLAVRADAPAIVAMISELAAHHGDVATIDAATLVRDAFGRRRRITILVATLAGKLVGYAAFSPLYRIQFAERGLDLGHLYVASHCRGQRVGRALLAALRNLALKLGVSFIGVSAAADNIAAQEFYLASGFSLAPSMPRFRLRLD